MFGVILTRRSSPATRKGHDLNRVILFPPRKTTGPDDLEGAIAGSARARAIAGEPLPGVGKFPPKSRRSRKAEIARARRLLDVKLHYIGHPSFDDPSARDAILAPAPESETPGQDRRRAFRDPDAHTSRADRIPSREREAHLFRKMNFLKYLAARIRERIDPDSPRPVDLDDVERLQAEALQLKNQIIVTHLPLVISIAKKRTSAREEICDRVSDGTFALMEAVERFDFARGFRFSTYATWAIFNELARRDRKEWGRRKHSVPLFYGSLAFSDVESEQYEQNEARDERTQAVERLLCRLDKRERCIMVNRHGIGGVPEQTLKQIGLDLGISKERARQLEERARAKLREFARIEGIEPADL